MQARIDRTNQVLREQITGIRVIRAFVREPEEGERFGIANADLTADLTSRRTPPAFMFPSVMLVLNVSSVAAVWFGGAGWRRRHADRHDDRVPHLPDPDPHRAMMATFVAVMWPRAAVCAARVKEVLDTPPTVAAPDVSGAPRCRCGRRSRCAT